MATITTDEFLDQGTTRTAGEAWTMNLPKSVTGVYCIENNINGKCYIGQSVNVRRRIRRHIRDIGNLKYVSAITLALAKYGEQSFSYKLLEQCQREELNDKEVYFINKFKCMAPNGYNLTSGGGCPEIISDRAKELMRNAKLGTKRSAESILKSTASRIETYKNDPDVRKRMSESRKRYRHSAETYKKIGEAQKGKDIPPDLRIKFARAHMNGKVIHCSNGETYLSTKEAAIACNIRTDSVLRVCSGKYKQAKGFVFWYEGRI